MKFVKSYEYWPSYLFYIPLLPYAVYLALKAKSGGFFYAANPGIENSGDGTESKFSTIQLIPSKYKPVTIFVPINSPIDPLLEKITLKKIIYPLIIKPDIGFRGLLVKKINTPNELIDYLKKYNSINLIIQEFITYPNECGVLFHKLPGQDKGTITSLTFKRFIAVTGDGSSTVSELISKDSRANKYTSLLKKQNSTILNTIPTKGKHIKLGDIGNHSKGTAFINANTSISQPLIDTFNNLNEQIKGWDYGRIDLKYENFEDLENGKSFKILEINGLISEPTHMYDASTGNYLKSLKEICKHWTIIYTISQENHRLHKVPFKNFNYFIKSLHKLQRYSTTIKQLKQ